MTLNGSLTGQYYLVFHSKCLGKKIAWRVVWFSASFPPSESPVDIHSHSKSPWQDMHAFWHILPHCAVIYRLVRKSGSLGRTR